MAAVGMEHFWSCDGVNATAPAFGIIPQRDALNMSIVAGTPTEFLNLGLTRYWYDPDTGESRWSMPSVKSLRYSSQSQIVC